MKGRLRGRVAKPKPKPKPKPQAQARSPKSDLVERALSSLEEAQQVRQREQLDLLTGSQLLQWGVHEVYRQVPQPPQSGGVAHEHRA